MSATMAAKYVIIIIAVIKTIQIINAEVMEKLQL